MKLTREVTILYKNLIICFLILILSSCKTRILTFDYNGYILSAKKTKKYMIDENIYETYIPTRKEISQVENTVREYTKKHYPNIHKKLKKYQRQYIGYYSEENKYLYINYYMDDIFFIFLNKYSDLATVDDGGDNYFKVIIDLLSKKIIYIQPNGHA